MAWLAGAMKAMGAAKAGMMSKMAGGGAATGAAGAAPSVGGMGGGGGGKGSFGHIASQGASPTVPGSAAAGGIPSAGGTGSGTGAGIGPMRPTTAQPSLGELTNMGDIMPGSSAAGLGAAPTSPMAPMEGGMLGAAGGTPMGGMGGGSMHPLLQQIMQAWMQSRSPQQQALMQGIMKRRRSA